MIEPERCVIGMESNGNEENFLCAFRLTEMKKEGTYVG